MKAGKGEESNRGEQGDVEKPIASAVERGKGFAKKRLARSRETPGRKKKGRQKKPPKISIKRGASQNNPRKGREDWRHQGKEGHHYHQREKRMDKT